MFYENNLQIQDHIMNFNYKGTFSVVLLWFADGDYRFTCVDVGCNGRVSDGSVFRISSHSRALSDSLLNISGERSLCKGITVPKVIVADDTFTLKYYIMKPYALRGLSEKKLNFNYHQLSPGGECFWNFSQSISFLFLTGVLIS